MRSDHAIQVAKFIHKKRYRTIAEIGVWKCGFAKRVLDACVNIREYWAIDAWEYPGPGHGRISNATDPERWRLMYWYACSHMMFYPSLRVVKLYSKDAVRLFPDGYFDLVFIDASHYYKDVRDDIEVWERKVRRRGMLCGHDYGNVRDNGVKRAVDERFGADGVWLGKGNTWFVEMR